MKEAFLRALVTTELPGRFIGKIKGTAIESIQDELRGNIGLALCLVHSPFEPYPRRSAGRAERATGKFWSWLCGEDLARGIARGHIISVHAGWKWAACAVDNKLASDMLSISNWLKATGLKNCVKAWRSIYSSAVGAFAQWERKWIDCEWPGDTTNWRCWLHHDYDTYELTRFRCIAGRVQYRADVGDDCKSIPIVYACVLGRVRHLLDRLEYALMDCCPISRSADAVWVKEHPGEHLTFDGIDYLCDGIAVKIDEVWDNVWMDGKSHAVVEKDGKRFAVLTGVSSTAEIGPDGYSRWYGVDPWNSHPEIKRRAACRVRQRTHSSGALMEQYDYPLQINAPWPHYNDLEIDGDLLVPMKAPTARE